MKLTPYDFKNTGAIICSYCGNEIEIGTTCMFMLGNWYHTECNRKAILGDE